MKKRRSTGRFYLLFVLFLYFFIQAFLNSTGLRENAVATSRNVTEKTGTSDTDSVKGQKSDECVILYQNQVSSQRIPLEEFLVGALAANIDISYEPETLKAQVVLLRGNCLRKLAGEGREGREGASGTVAASDQGTIVYEELEMDYYTFEELRTIWGEDFEINYEKARKAVQQTVGIYAKSGGQILNGNFHSMSAGRTRSGREVFADESFDYLQSVPCDKNEEDENYLKTSRFKKEKDGEFRILERDSAGYVTRILWNGKELGGEQVREALGLASSNFEIEESEDYVITTKGIGHGFGFDQYYANYLAGENGSDYMTLISYFFKDISFTSDPFDV